MTYGRVAQPTNGEDLDGATVSHLAELVRGNFLHLDEGPLIRPFGPLLPKGRRGLAAYRRITQLTPHRLGEAREAVGDDVPVLLRLEVAALARAVLGEAGDEGRAEPDLGGGGQVAVVGRH
jgi:hypothetical protein